ncbi:MAG: hypothetical protein U1F98_11685 [Verrucomicrobiota bacterium]
MINKLIGVLAVALLVWGGVELSRYYQRIEYERVNGPREKASQEFRPDRLPGMSYLLEDSLAAAQAQGANALHNWLRNFGPQLEDPRKAWIELDYCVMLAKDNPAEARRLFAEIRDRTPPSSPVYPRIQQLAKTYQ